MNPLTMLPAKYRRAIYGFYATLGISFGAVQVGFATADVSQPTWLLVAFGVFGYLGTALGLVAVSNVTPDRRPQDVTFGLSPGATIDGQALADAIAAEVTDRTSDEPGE